MLRRMLRILGKDSLAKQLKYPCYTVKHIDLPPPELVEKIIEEQKRLRTQVILALLCETGARLSEILSLIGKHVTETSQGYYRIVIEEPKNGEFRIVYVIKYAGLLRQYLDLRKPKPEEYLFPSPVYRDRPIHPEKHREATTQTIQEIRRKTAPTHSTPLKGNTIREGRITGKDNNEATRPQIGENDENLRKLSTPRRRRSGTKTLWCAATKSG